MYHTGVDYHLNDDPYFCHELQLYTNDHTGESFLNVGHQFNAIDDWIERHPSIGRYIRSGRFRYGWAFLRKEDAMLVKLTFG